MHLPQLLQQRIADALGDLVDEPERYAAMVRATNDPKYGDYQANGAMPLSKVLNKDSVEVASDLISKLDVSDICDEPEVAGKGFINLRLKDSFVTDSIQKILGDARCGVASTSAVETIVIDFSSPNVAKPMHVGHIRSTVIGDALARILGFLGHRIITDNHLGDWGTQFGIIIYGYKHFGDAAVVEKNPVAELSKLYRVVNQLVEYQKALGSIDSLQASLAEAQNAIEPAQAAADSAEGKAAKKAKKALDAARRRCAAIEGNLHDAREKVKAVQADPGLREKADAHPRIDADVLEETAKLHQGDEENLALWRKFLPYCEDEINRVYARLNVDFDHTLGESFYHPMLAGVVTRLQQAGLATESDGAICVFLPEFEAPMIVQKQDGAFLYATTDLATLQYRREQFDPAEILYVVDTRQSEHFEKLFAVASHFGLENIKLVHVNFGTVLGDDGRPMKTRSGSLIGLESLLDDAVQRAKQVVCDPGRLANFDPPMDQGEQEMIADAVGIGAIKFADLGHHRTSDYQFNLDKMVALEGNTSAYVQYSYARTQNILERAEKCESDISKMAVEHGLAFTHGAERDLAIMLLKFEAALVAVHKDYAPNQLVDYLLDTAKAYSRFNDNCHVLRAESQTIQTTRLALVTLTGRVLQTGLGLLGVQVVPRM